MLWVLKLWAKKAVVRAFVVLLLLIVAQATTNTPHCCFQPSVATPSQVAASGVRQAFRSGRPRCPVLAHLPHLLPASCVHCIVTDVPYGHRTEVVVPDAGAENVTEAEWQQLLRQLLALAGKVLVDAGRLAVWLPLSTGWRYGLTCGADPVCVCVSPGRELGSGEYDLGQLKIRPSCNPKAARQNFKAPPPPRKSADSFWGRT